MLSVVTTLVSVLILVSILVLILGIENPLRVRAARIMVKNQK